MDTYWGPPFHHSFIPPLKEGQMKGQTFFTKGTFFNRHDMCCFGHDSFKSVSVGEHNNLPLFCCNFVPTRGHREDKRGHRKDAAEPNVQFSPLFNLFPL